MRILIKRLFFFSSVALATFLLDFPFNAMSQVPDVGPTRCIGGCETTPGRGSVYTPSGPSAEQLKQQREAKDLSDAAIDANDRGVDAFARGDYDAAVRYLSEAAEYAPDDSGIQSNLERARAAFRQSQAARQGKSTEAHGETARQLRNESASEQARKGFDTGGKSAGTLDTSTVRGDVKRDPVVPAAKRTAKISSLEKQRAAMRKEIAALDAKRKALDPKKDAVAISKIKQDVSTRESKIDYLNFSITEELEKPARKAK